MVEAGSEVEGSAMVVVARVVASWAEEMAAE